MTDKELLELAAKAAGYNFEWFGQHFHIGIDERRFTSWNPLTDDGDALRLAVKLKIRIVEFDDTVVKARAVSWNKGNAVCALWEPEGDDPYAATRRAIVRAAAEIGKEMK